TYSGSPVACAAAIEAVNTINTPEFLNRATQVGKTIRENMLQWKQKYSLIGDVRGLGAMMLVEFVKDHETKEPAAAETLEIIRYAYQHGLILIRAGLYSNGIRLLPPLNMPDDMLMEGLAVLEAGIAQVAS
ncbi:MAG: aminotransferase class III-fold pyridoxal phosphate-dependent enzyme, partial [Anaerolineae bacterium]|nr:aminotransferase class III-fold pyridoxal phosphate-dependent enzyme [Anaerolineae bacterium]